MMEDQKEHKEVTVDIEGYKYNWYYVCSECRCKLNWKEQTCPECKRRINWDE